MDSLTCTLLGDGPSDDALLPILRWLLGRCVPHVPVQLQWADLRGLRKRPVGLAERLRCALDLYPCDLLFIHRVAEREAAQHRVLEIAAAVGAAAVAPPHVCVVPVRMTEAWCLFDEAAIRRAAGNPNGRQLLDLPRLQDLEAIPDPKQLLRALLRHASGLRGRRLHQLNVPPRRVTALIDDFSPLRGLGAFRRLEDEFRRALRSE
jgi:hypothetical protein